MEKGKRDLGTVAASAGKTAAGFFDKAKRAVVNAVDQDEDGKITFNDVSAFTKAAMESAKETNEKQLAFQTRVKREKERKNLAPLFEEDLDEPEFMLPKLVRISEMDKKRVESEVCVGSVGYESKQKDLRIVNIFPDKTDLFGLTFYPDKECGLYYMDPSDRDLYIALDDYFNYLKVARISELQKIAQELGAKHFKVTYKEHKKSFSSKNGEGTIGAKVSKKFGGDISASRQREDVGFEKVEIAAEMECVGHKPVEPVLKYFKKDPQIQNLIALRMAPDNEIRHQRYILELSNSSGIKVKDAIKIDAALSAMKLDGNVTVASEAQRESRCIFEYEIDF